jgi:hypothetical protein
MDEQTNVPEPKRRNLWVYPVGVFLVTAIGFPIAAGFYSPTGPTARVHLPGVIISVAMANAVSVFFIRCPRRPILVKILTLVLAVPALFFAVDCVMSHLAFGMSSPT